jgi:hypothetical protein
VIKRFNRYELKYILSAAVADAITAELSSYVTPDPEGGATGVYQVTSLYYDTPSRSFFNAKIEGIKYRRKLRVRRYGDLGRAPGAVAVEIKQRINRTTQKRRLGLPLAEALALCDGDGPTSFDDPGDTAVAGEVEFLVRSLHLRPSCTVSYLRQAFLGGPYETGLRVTFDRYLWCREPVFALGTDGPRYLYLPADRVVMEVKANDAVPLWLSRMLARHACPLRRFSKYCAALACLLALPKSETLRLEEA